MFQVLRLIILQSQIIIEYQIHLIIIVLLQNKYVGTLGGKQTYSQKTQTRKQLTWQKPENSRQKHDNLHKQKIVETKFYVALQVCTH